MYNLCLRADEKLTPGLEQQIDICSRLLIPNMEVNDGTGGKPWTELSGAELEHYRSLLIRHHKKIVLLNASKPLSEYDYYKKLFARALLLQVENVKVKVGEDSPVNEAELDALRQIAELARLHGIGIVIENDSRTALSDDRTLTAVYSRFKEYPVSIAFNPLEFVRTKAHPFFHVYYNSKLKGKVGFLRVNDGLFADGSAVVPGDGNAEVKELVSILLKRSYKGYFSFTPYMENADEALFALMLERFKKMLLEM